MCRHYQTDLWGHVFFAGKITRLLRIFLRYRKEKRTWYPPLGLRLDIPRRLRRRKRQSLYGKRLDTRKKLCFFYGGLRKSSYRKINRLSNKNFIELGTVALLELRLASVVYRAHFALTILESIQFIQRGLVMVNKKVIKRPAYIVKKGDVIEMLPFFKKNCFTRLHHSFVEGNLLVVEYPYLEINYSVCSAFIVRIPKAGEVPIPFKVTDGFTLSEYKGKD